MIEPLNCPFCGSKNIQVLPYRRNNPWMAHCTQCYARSGFYESKEIAIERWNKRISPISNNYSIC